ncbi:MAG: hypothetical protein ABH881_01570 [bacterium]
MKYDNIIVSHAEDVDGIISAALLLRKIGKEECAKTKIILIAHSEEEKMFDLLVSLKGRNIFVADLSAKTEFIRRVYSSSPCYVMWIDHHQDTIDNQITLDEFHYNYAVGKGVCAAMLIHRSNTLSDDSYAEKLADIAQCSDYPEEGDRLCEISGASNSCFEEGKKLQNAISFLNSYPGMKSALEQIVRELAREELFGSIFYSRLVESYKESIQKESDSLLRNVRRFSFSDLSFLVSYASSLFHSKETVEGFIRDVGECADGYIIAFGPPTNNVLFFKHPDSKIDSVSFCKHMGGGGRDGKGGFGVKNMGGKVNAASFPQFVEKLASELRRFYSE